MSDSLQQELDFWEFVACSRCQLPFVPEPRAPPQVPFWLTECGHVICNNHLNPDQSCTQCGARDIQLVPLQREMDPPMSDWFRSIPHALDGVASAAKFQHEVLCYQVRHYKARYKQARELIDKIKREAAENKVLKKTIEDLRHENEQLRQHLGISHSYDQGAEEGSDIMSSNKKRRLTDQQRSGSSPRSITTPLGPNRLTLPPGQLPPSLSSRRPSEGTDNPANSTNTNPSASQRPGSSRFIEQYSYAPPQSSRYAPQSFSNTQNASAHQFPEVRVDHDQARPNAMMLPPPASAPRFKPAQARSPVNIPQGSNAANISRPTTRIQCQANDGDRRRTEMGPPPVPVFQPTRLPVNQSSGYETNAMPQSFQRNAPGLSASNRFIPTAHGQRSIPATPDGQRFTHSASSGSSGPQRFMVAPPTGAVSGSRAPSRSAKFKPSMPGTQRTPFVPGAQGRFG